MKQSTKLFWMRFVPADYLADTMHLSTEQHGAYLLLIFAYWQRKGPLPDDDTFLSNVTRLSLTQWLTHRSVISEFFGVSSGKWHHRRIESELAEARELSGKQSEGGKKGAEIRWGRKTLGEPMGEPLAPLEGQPMGDRMHNHSHNYSHSNNNNSQPQPVPYVLSGKPDNEHTPEPPEVPSAMEDTPESTPRNYKRSKTKELAKDVLAHLNSTAGRSFRETTETLDLIACRLEEVGLDTLGVEKMIDRQVARWKGDQEMEEYLRPSTLFNKTKFSGYYDVRDLPVSGKARRNDADYEKPF